MAAGRSIVVVGAGIGGLTTAIALARQGIGVTVLERAGELHEVGAGIQISPNASRLLLDLGLGPHLGERTVQPRGIRVCSAQAGGEVAFIDLADAAARFGAPFWTIHRADLQAALAELAATLPGIRLELDAHLHGAAASGDGVSLDVSLGAQRQPLHADGLIGADGVHSAVRTRHLGGPQAAYTGRLAYRAVIPIDETPEDLRDTASLWMAPSAHLVHYPVRATRELNIVAIFEGDWTDESWSASALRDDVIRQFSALTGTPWPERVRALVGAPVSWTKWALRGVPAGFAWSRGPISLIGDAAHAMLPFAAQGACMAIEDAVVLANHLAADRPVAAALAAYESARRPRVSAVVDLARRNGKAYHLGPTLGRLRDVALRLAGGARILDRQAWVYDWSAP